jgi:hypothetical protein
MRIFTPILSMVLLILFVSEDFRIDTESWGVLESLAITLICGSTITIILYVFLACDRPWFVFLCTRREE